MFTLVRGSLVCIAMLMLSIPASAAEVTKEQLKSLDEQVQDIKTDTLGIGAEMRLLEEKLLYPSSTQVAVFVSLDSAATLRLDSIEIRLDGKSAAQHLYTLRELEALKKGGTQRIYTGNVKSGEHSLQVLVTGKTLGGPGLSRTESFKFSKDVGPKVVEIRLVDSDSHIITFRDW